MPVDKFGRMSDTKTKDTGVSLTYIDNNYVRSDGGTPLTGSLDMKGNIIYNVADPVNPQDVVTKVYVDNTKGSGVIGRKIGDSVSIKENLDVLGKQKIKNLPDPVNDKDAVTKEYVDNLQTQYIDKRGNVRFDRNINVGNNRIFSLKDPKKDYEATDKKYVDESINKRLQEEKDKFLPQDPATKEYVDEAVKQLAGGDLLVSKEGVFIKANGHYRATAPLDIDNHKMENLREPLEDGDAVNKKYVDGIVEDLTLKQGLIRENGGFNLVDSYINMNFNNIRNVGNPKHEADAVPFGFMVKELEEKIEKLPHLIAIHSSYTGPLIKNKEQFTFGGNDIKNTYTGFLMPHSGRFKKIKMKTNITKNIFENVVFKKDRADVDFIGSGFFSFTKTHYDKQLKKNQGLILGSILCYDAYKLYVKGNPDAGVFFLKEQFVGYDFCFEDDLPIVPEYNLLKEGDIINVSTMIDLDLTKYGLDDPNANTYHVTILIELDPL